MRRFFLLVRNEALEQDCGKRWLCELAPRLLNSACGNHRIALGVTGSVVHVRLVQCCSECNVRSPQHHKEY